MKNFCGLDFGTSNSTVGLAAGNGFTMCPLEGESVTLPSAVFFDYENHKVCFGRDAVGSYIEGTEGRLLRSLKSVLGSTLIDETTLIQRKRVPMRDIIGMFMRYLKAQVEQKLGGPVEHVVLGRPVRFVDDDDEADIRAEAELIGIAKAQGFRHVEMQFEPVAAALAYEQSLTREELALIIDLGGGTSDFAVARLSPERSRWPDRSSDILGRSGVHIGGTDFDRQLSINHVMPMLGYNALIGPKKLPMPSHLYHDLATWHRIPTLYTPQNINYLRSILIQLDYPDLIEQLIDVFVERKGHRIAARVEAAKIALSERSEVTLHVPLMPPVDKILNQAQLDEVVSEDATKILRSIDQCLSAAGIKHKDIQSIFLTGGSTAVPEIKRQILSHLPGARPITGDLFGSVGLGLAMDAARKFG